MDILPSMILILSGSTMKHQYEGY